VLKKKLFKVGNHTFDKVSKVVLVVLKIIVLVLFFIVANVKKICFYNAMLFKNNFDYS
jgi:hypothetical protein